MLRLYRKEEGFTLIELLIVVAIIGILAGIAVPRITGSVEKAKIAACDANISAIESAAQVYYIDKGSYPTNVDELVTAGYVKEAPKCPVKESVAYTLGTDGIVTHTH